MDEMKIKISTKFMKNMISKILIKAVYKNIGIRPDIHINELSAEMKEGKIRFHINADGEVDESALVKINRLLDEWKFAKITTPIMGYCYFGKRKRKGQF